MQKFVFSLASIDIRDFISTNKAFDFLLESRCADVNEAKSCIYAQFINDTSSPKSDLNLIMNSNSQLLFCINFHTIFSLASNLGEAVFKESIEMAYYRDFAKAALTKIDEYIQLGIAMAVTVFFNPLQ